MKERVAKAIREANNDWWESVSEPDHDLADVLARVAIEAMREPTEAMVAAANRNNHPRDLDTWQTMIDAALALPNEQ